jgi:arginyl-tRNA synthetase
MAAAAEATKTVKERFERAGKLKAFAVDEDELAREIGVSAVVFNDLKRDREGDIEFNSDTAKTLEAGSSQYIQYANARLNSLFERAGELPPLPETLPELSPAERNLLRAVADMPLRVREAADHNNPHRLASYLTSLAQETSVFYDTHKGILKASDPERAVRLNLLRAAQTAIQNSAKLLHIDLPERM